MSDVDRYRTQGQIVFTVALALLGLIVAGLQKVVDDGEIVGFVVWVISVALAGLGGAAAVGAVFGRADLTHIQLSKLKPDPPTGNLPTPSRRNLEWLAEGYLEASAANAHSVATLVTVVRDAVFLVASSAITYLVLIVALLLLSA